MNTKALANHYATLTPEERFRLILTAAGRDDETEIDRLVNAGQRFTLSMPAHAAHAHAFQELASVISFELLEDAASYLEARDWADDDLRVSIADKRKIPKTKRPPKEDKNELPEWQQSMRLSYGLGFIFKMKMAGFELFCGRWNTSPATLWGIMKLSGLPRLRRALALAVDGLAYRDSAAMLCWVNEVRPPGDPEWAEADLMTAEQYANELDALFRKRAKCWGGR